MQHPIELVSLVETKATPVQPWGIEVKFVEPSSAGLPKNIPNFSNDELHNQNVYIFISPDLCCGEIHFIPVNHLEICKPLNRYTKKYLFIGSLIKF